MFKKLLINTVVAGIIATTPTYVLAAADDTSSPAMSKMDQAPKHPHKSSKHSSHKHKHTAKKHKTKHTSNGSDTPK